MPFVRGFNAVTLQRAGGANCQDRSKMNAKRAVKTHQPLAIRLYDDNCDVNPREAKCLLGYEARKEPKRDDQVESFG